MSTLKRLFLLAGFVVFLGACAAEPVARPLEPAPGAMQASYSTIDVAELKLRLDRGDPLLLLDVRSPEEYSGDGHILGSTLLPLPELGQRMGELDSAQPIVCICRSGNRSRSACDQLAQAGFRNLVNVDGGMLAWAAAGYPIER